MSNKSIHFTLDFEADLGSAAAAKSHDALRRTDRLIEIADQLRLPLTVFCEGEILEKYFELVEPLVACGAEIELHSYDHSATYASPEQRIANMKKGLRAYRDRFSANPRVFRAPDGMVGTPELTALAEEKIEFDSSIFPTRFPGRFDNSHLPRTPFRVAGLPLIELPFATVNRVRIPVALSYFQLLGSTLFRALIRTLGTNQQIVFDFHMHDLVKGAWHKQAGVSRSVRLGYWRAQSHADPSTALAKIARLFLAWGYEPLPLSALYENLDRDSLPEVSLS